jgi:hypothetical protein
MPIPGGTDIDKIDQDFVGQIYPKAVNPPVKPPVKPPVSPDDLRAKIDNIFHILISQNIRRMSNVQCLRFSQLLMDTYLQNNPIQ